MWVWALVEQADTDVDMFRRLKAMVRKVVRDTTGLWAYVLIRSADEAEVTA